MTREDAKVWLGRETAATSEPSLGSPDLDLLLDTFSQTKDGVEFFDLASLNRAAAEGWGWKASASAEYSGKEAQIHDHAVSRQKYYAARAAGGGAVRKPCVSKTVKSLL
jgi:hypothetical protein